MKIDIQNIYPNFRKGESINPRLLVESMIILQAQEQKYVVDSIEYSKNVDRIRFEIDVLEKKVDEFIEKALIGGIKNGTIPYAFRKSKELTLAYVKHGGENSSEYVSMNDDLILKEKELMEAKNLSRGCDSIINVIRNAVSTGIQVLSYLKHEEKFSGSI